MKIFKKSCEEKSWSVALKEDGTSVNLEAVDSKTGVWLATFISIKGDGDVVVLMMARESLSKKGYDPRQYNNEYNANGSLKISVQ